MHQDKSGVRVFLSLGSNLGDSPGNLREAFINLCVELEDPRISGLYITEPQDVSDQPDFINAACTGLFSGTPFELLYRLNKIESDMGRDRSKSVRRGPRIIDIDILLFGDEVIDETDSSQRSLIIPHPRLRERRFALVPLLELAPDLSDPVTGKPYSVYLERLEGQNVIPF